MVLFNGCGSETGGTVSEEEAIASETCTGCHGPGRTADVEAVHYPDVALEATVTAVTMPNAATTGGRPTVEFSVVDRDGIGVPGLTFSFTIAKLVPPDARGDPNRWQSYINRARLRTQNGAVGTNVVQASTESEGALTDAENGDYTYTFATDLSNVTTAAASTQSDSTGSVDVPFPVSYDPDLTHRIGLQIDSSDSLSANSVLDFVPAYLPEITADSTRDVVATAFCNECHGRLAAHDNRTVEARYCVMCHNPGSRDSLSEGESINFGPMIHKIHRGRNLPIGGYTINLHDYSGVVYPQDIRNCSKCHDGYDALAPDGGNWLTASSIEACSSCHNNVRFNTPVPEGMVLHSGGAQSGNLMCAICHSNEALPFYTGTMHRIPVQAAAESFMFVVADVTDTAPGQNPRITFSVMDPATGMHYDIQSDPEFAPGSSAQIGVLIAWPTDGYGNSGSGSDPGQPVRIDALTDATVNGDGTYTITSTTPIPEDVKGSGAVVIEGYAAMEGDTPGIYDTKVPVRNVVRTFAISDAVPMSRRDVVDIGKCNQCHGNLSQHGDRHSGSADACVVCHNAYATDINGRPDDPAAAADGKREETIDFKHTIHAIHAAGIREAGIVIYGNDGSEAGSGNVGYPGNVAQCKACHLSSTFSLPLSPEVRPTAVGTGIDLADPGDDLYMTPIASVCSPCHDSPDSLSHMQENGSGFAVDASALTLGGNAGKPLPPAHTTAPGCTAEYACHG